MSNRLGFKIPSDDTQYNDAYTTWLLHTDGPTNSTYMLDHSVKQNGAAVVVSAYVIGDGSSGPGPLHATAVQFNNNAYVYSPVNVDNSFNLWLNDFTIDWWEHRIGDVTALRPSFTWDTVATTYSPMLVGWGDNSAIYYYASNDAASWNIVSAMFMGTAILNAWVHRAIVRKGSTFYAFENGVLKGTATSTLAFNNATYGPMVGCWPNPAGYLYFWGYMQEFRVSNGIARWTANFTPPTRKYEPYPDLNTRLLMHFGGNYDDNSQYRRGTATVTGSPLVTNGTGKFGRAAVRFDGASYLSFPDSPHWVIGAQDFTFDAWVYLDQGYPPVNNFCLLSQMTSIGSYSDRHFFAYIGPNGAVVSDAFAGSAQIYMTATAASAVPLNVWTHVAVVRSGTAVQIYVNGVLKSGYVLPANYSFQDLTGPMTVGAMFSDQMFKGYIDEVRFVVGKAMWTANFTPPTEAYPITPDKTVLLLHLDTDLNDTSAKRHGPLILDATSALSKTQSKFGGSSLSLPNSGSALGYFQHSSDFGFSVEDFTIDFWFYSTGAAGVDRMLFGKVGADLTNASYGGNISSGSFLQFNACKTGSDWGTQVNLVGNAVATSNVWHHYAVTRQSYVFRLFLDGVLTAGPVDAGVWPLFDNSLPLVIGRLGQYPGYMGGGFIDEFRITKGAALWSANFTPPTQAGS